MGMTELKASKNYKSISKDVNTFVLEKLGSYDTCNIGGKTIHDPIWGSTQYNAWEMQIIDSPLIQRLRNISQVGLAVLTYPAARHSRFEHTIGVAAATKRLIERINSNSNFVINDEVKCKLVLAAIMHDVGHCFYSHLSETIYENLKEFSDLRKDIKINFPDSNKPKSHEIMSFVIVNCESFKEFFINKVDYPYKEKVELLLEDVGKIIMGLNIENGTSIDSYQTAIINGSFDVDKIDYIKRDSYTAGLALDFDIERLFTKIQIHTLSIEGGKVENRLVIQANGVTAIEELTFCKIMLFSYIYYHQKVLITEDIIRDYAQALLKIDLINSYADFLRLDEASLLKLSEKQNGSQPFPQVCSNFDLEKLANNIKNRVLPKRCLEISQSILRKFDYISDNKEQRLKSLLTKIITTNGYNEEMLNADINEMISYYTRSNERYIADFMSKLETTTFEDVLVIRKKIFEELVEIYKENEEPICFNLFDIYFVIPKEVSYGTPGEKNVLGRNGEMMSINDFVKLEQWASSFNAYKWRGYVYISKEIKQEYAIEACNKVIFGNKMDIKELNSYLK